VSKAYDIILNGGGRIFVDQRSVTTAGKTSPQAIFLQMSVADAPYRLPVQDLYQAQHGFGLFEAGA